MFNNNLYTEKVFKIITDILKNNHITYASNDNTLRTEIQIGISPEFNITYDVINNIIIDNIREYQPKINNKVSVLSSNDFISILVHKY